MVTDFLTWFESKKPDQKEKSAWISCALVKLAPSFESVQEHLKGKAEISEAEYKKVCKEMFKELT